MTARMRLFAACFVAGVAFAAAIGATTDDSVPDGKFLEYAKGFAPYTARLKVPCDNGTTCEASATVVSEHWAITAAHVVDSSDSATLVLGGSEMPVSGIVRHPDFAHEALGRNDLALLYCEKAFGLDFYPPLSDGEEQVGDVVSLAGYGLHGPMSTGYAASDGRLRAGTNHIERFEGAIIVCTASPGKSKYEACISPGDSGGPLFCRGRLAGVHSITMAPRGPLRSRAGEESGHVRVSLYRDWIDSVIKGKDSQ